MQACLSIKSYGFTRFKAHVIQKNQYFVMTSSYACCCAANIDFFLRIREMATADLKEKHSSKAILYNTRYRI